MSVRAPSSDEAQVAETILALLQEARVATLATLDHDGGHPYASLVDVAASAEHTPLMLLSDLARHTRNLTADRRASLLIDRRGREGGLADSRVTVIGTAERSAEAGDREAYLARHPQARAWADLGDFAVWRLAPSSFHLVAGFGRIRTVTAAEVLHWASSTPAIAAAEIVPTPAGGGAILRGSRT